MKIAILNDTHFGCRKDAHFFQQKQLEWLSNQFIPAIKEHNVKRIIHLGDVFDNRVNVNIHTLSVFKEAFFDEILNRLNIDLDIILGNHDCFYKNMTHCSIPEILQSSYENLTVYTDEWLIDIHQETIGRMPFIFIPWISNQEQWAMIEQALERIPLKEAQQTTVLGHFQFIGCAMGKFGVCEHGTPLQPFRKFKRVISGHFHNPSENGNVWYPGNPFFTSWNDYGDEKGFLILDTDTQEYQKITTNDKVYHIVDYNKNISNDYKNQVLKVYISQNEVKTDTAKQQFANFIEALYQKGNIVEIEYQDEANEAVNTLADYKHQKEVSSLEFVKEVIEESSLEHKAEVFDYMKQLSAQTNGEQP